MSHNNRDEQYTSSSHMFKVSQALPKTTMTMLKPVKKGAFSSKKLKPSDLSSVIVKKLHQVTNSPQKTFLVRTPKEEQIKAYCRTMDISKLQEPIVSHTEWAFIPMKVVRYNSPFDLDKEVAYTSVVPHNPDGQSWKIFKEYNNYNKEFINDKSIENNLEMDVKWLQRQITYINSLPKYDIYTLKGYTYYGDVMVNSLLRDIIEWDNVANMNKDFFDSFEYFPLYFQLDSIVTHVLMHHGKLGAYSLFNKPEKTMVRLYTKPNNGKIPRSANLASYIELIVKNYNQWQHSDKYIVLVSLWGMLYDVVHKKAIQLFQQDLTRIINKSPALTRDITVYRGVRNDFYLQGAKNGYYKNIGFVSTSLDVEKAQFFQMLGQEETSNSCCIQKITLLKGTRVLLMMVTSQYGDEKEVLLNHGSTYMIKEPKIMKTFYQKAYEKSYDICHQDTYDLQVSEIILTS